MRRYPGGGEAQMVSLNGGSGPAWNPNGSELFYLESNQSRDRLMSVPMSASGRVERPVELFSKDRGQLFAGTSVFTPYAVAADGQRFYAVRALARPPLRVTDIHVVLNWLDELKQRLAVK
jgi:hypothetical protein